MGTGYKSLKVWHDAKALAVEVYKASTPMRDASLKDQIRRAAVSVPSNIAEGDERDTDRDSIRCFYIAKGSLAELCTQIEIAAEVGLLTPMAAENLLASATLVGKRLGALIKARTASSPPPI